MRPGAARLTYRPTLVPVPAIAGRPAGDRELISFDALFATPPANVRVFLGPKDFDILKAVDGDLVRSIDFGIFSPIAVPLLHALKWIDGFVGNYGWSIILLTIFINIVDLPAAPQERRVDAEDAADAAAGEGDPGSLRRAQDDGPGKRRR